jgi:hypothetical protein
MESAPRMPRAGWRPRLAVAGVILVLAGLLRLQPPLASLFCALPLLAAAAMPDGWWRVRGERVLLVLAALGLGHAPVVLAVMEARAVGATTVGWSLLVQGWCAAGLGLLIAVALVRWSRWCGARWWLRALGAVPFAVLAILALLPLRLLYRPNLAEPAPAAFAGERFIITGHGVDFAARWQESPGDRGALVFVHGVGLWEEHYYEHLDFLRSLGWAVLSYDLRSHGRSTPGAVTYGLRDADDLAGPIWAEARRRAAGRPLAVYGLSMGGAIALLGGHRLEGCAALIAESAYAELAPLVRRALGPATQLGRLWCLADGWDPLAIRPVDAPVLQAGPPLLLGSAGRDVVVPSEHGLALALAAPRARVVHDEQLAHTRLVRDSPAWRKAVAEVLAATLVGR